MKSCLYKILLIGTATASVFDSITVKMVESNDVAYQLYQSGEVDYVELSESNVKTISSDENNPYHDKMVEWKKNICFGADEVQL